MTNKSIAKLLILTSVIFISSITCADVKLPAIFGDHMVLQQKEKVAVWGWAEPGEKVTVKGSWPWSKKTTKADENGQWKVKIKTPKAGGPYTLTIRGNNEIILNDILMGEVWICSGQSNMEFTMNMLKSEAIDADAAKADLPKLRLFTVKRKISFKPLEDVEGSWQACSPDAVRDFSATAFYFGKKLQEELDVPIGLISTSWGGTRAEAWTRREAIETFDCFHDTLELIDSPKDNENQLEQLYRQEVAAWEKSVNDIDAGFQGGWHKSNFDDAQWETMEQPTEWKGTEFDKYDGIIWFRRFTNLPPSWANKDLELHLGPIDDVGTVWFNGVKIGTPSTKRVYTIPASLLHTGKNSIAVRIIDTGGNGGFRGKSEDMRIGPVGADVKIYATVAGTWKYKAALAERLSRPPANPKKVGSNTPTALYNAMIAPLIPFRMAGVIWYQGESNCYDPILYRTLFPAMITDWRKQWDLGDFPFYYVQIAPYAYRPDEASQAIREAQLMTLDAVPNVGMAVTMDIGEENDIHPKNKWDVGDRLTRWALAKSYGKKDIAHSGPIYQEMGIEDGKIRLVFNHTYGGLVAKDGKLTDFMIAGEDRKFVPAQAEIREHSEQHGKSIISDSYIVVWSDEVPEPVAVRYGWSNWVSGSLFNGADLPASSFRTDDWPLQ